MLRCALRDCCRPVCLRGGLPVRPPGPTAVRSLHVQPLPAADLVAKVNAALLQRIAFELTRQATGAFIQDSATTTDAAPHEAIKLTIFASRQLNKPAVKISGEVIPLDINRGIDGDVSDRVATAMGTRDLLKTAGALYELCKANDLLRLEAGAGVRDGDAVLSDVSIAADDFALYRQPHLSLIADTSTEHPLETQAKAGALFYHKNTKSKGNIAAYGYGAGVAMSTMDALAAAGGRPANFLDGGGGATEANVRAALEVVTSDGDADVVFVNSFGGLTKTDLIAQGIVDFLRGRKDYKPFVVRLRGTGEAEAKRILEEAAIPNLQYIPDLQTAAAAAVRIASSARPASPAPIPQPVERLHPVVFSQDGQYEQTIDNVLVQKDAPVLIMGTGKASQFHNGVAQQYGTNIVGACAPGKGGAEFLSRPVYSTLAEANAALRPQVVSVFVPPKAAADAIIECVEQEIPLVVAYAEGVPTSDQLRIQAAIRSQSQSRLIGANCPGMILPHSRVKLGIQPLSVHAPGCVGLASRSGTISYELASQTTTLGLGQSVVFGLGGDPFPGTRTWEALSVMLHDPLTKVICLIGEVGGQMEEEAAEVYTEYVAKMKREKREREIKPVVGFIAGQQTERGKMYGHAGAVWYEDWESAASKKKCWEEAGFRMAPTLGDVGALLKEEAARVGTA